MRPAGEMRGIASSRGDIRVEGRDGRVVCERCTVAATPLTRLRGLLGRRALEEGEGLLLRPCASVHTAFMSFAVDALFLAADGEVLRIAAELRPWRAAIRRGARQVLELRAGAAASVGLGEGERLILPAG